MFGQNEFSSSSIINLEKCGVSSRERLGKNLTVVVADSSEVVISEVSDEPQTVGIWTTIPEIVLVAKEYIKHDIWGRILIDAIGEEKFQQLCTNNELLAYLIKNR